MQDKDEIIKERKNYDIRKILSCFDELSSITSYTDFIDYIIATPTEFSVYFSNQISLLSLDDIENLKGIFMPDVLFFDNNSSRLAISNTSVQNTIFTNEVIKYFISFINDCANIICPCTGSEIYLDKKSIKIFIDQINLTSDEFYDVFYLFHQQNLIFEIVFESRPFIRVSDYQIMMGD